ncbi:unnamed protein product [Rotaria magnacalcarata]|uniref:DUF1772-domain-containing protein n=2 Tax=Rotaria magnacalcarata TaxID=392030 RepID=A0A816NUX3_9BILA|nr:unnamed protein product [Rotaria magnacalcarata]
MSSTAVSILDHLDKVAVLSAGLFAGTALYMTIGEVPAMRAIGGDIQWRFFPYMYERAAVSQASLAVIAGVAGVLHGTRIVRAPSDRNLWIAAGTIFIGIIPYTVICMLPTNLRIINDNKRIQAGSESQIDPATQKKLLDKWTSLHLVRTVGSLVGFTAMAFGLSQHKSLLLRW